jgi:hypothetical protein
MIYPEKEKVENNQKDKEESKESLGCPPVSQVESRSTKPPYTCFLESLESPFLSPPLEWGRTAHLRIVFKPKVLIQRSRT